jgi:hypothetical protein
MVSVYYYDLPSLMISKVARGAERDLDDVEHVVRSGAIAWDDVEATRQEVRASRRGWLRHDPAVIERRLAGMCQRLGILSNHEGASGTA